MLINQAFNNKSITKKYFYYKPYFKMKISTAKGYDQRFEIWKQWGIPDKKRSK